MNRMSVRYLMLLVLLLPIFALAHQEAAKGYQLYSWKVGSRWHYSLLPFSNGELTKEEILSNSNVKIGDAAFRKELKKLARGQRVSWMSDAPEGVTTPTGKHTTGFKQPSRKRIARLKAYCDKLGIELILR